MGMKWLASPLAVGVLVTAAFGIWTFTTRHSATPEVVEGWAMPIGHGTAIALHDSDDGRRGNAYIVAGVHWAGRDGMWHDGTDGPTCVGTDTSTRTRVRLGIVDVRPGQEGVGGPRVMWLRCLE